MADASADPGCSVGGGGGPTDFLIMEILDMKRILHTVAPYALALAVSVAGAAPTLHAQATGGTMPMQTTGDMDMRDDDEGGFDMGWLGLLGLLGLLGMRKKDHVHTTHDSTAGATRRP